MAQQEARLFVGTPAGSALLRLNLLGVAEPMYGSVVNRPQGTGDWLLMCFPAGSYLIADQNGPERHQGPCWIVWQPGDNHMYGDDQRNWLHSWVHCEGDLMEELVTGSGLECNRVLPLHDARVFDRCCVALAEEAVHTHCDPLILRNGLDTLLRAQVRNGGGRQGPVHECLTAARRLLEERFTEALSLQELAALGPWSPAHFSMRFRQCFGHAPMTWLRHLRLRQALYLLHDRNRSIAAVGEAVGYTDPYHFSRLMRQHFGKSPRALRADLENC